MKYEFQILESSVLYQNMDDRAAQEGTPRDRGKVPGTDGPVDDFHLFFFIFFIKK